MPKASKKKEKHADFSKAKFKLGKGKKQASNATDTSFKARSIALPGQQQLNRALTNRSEGEIVTAAGLTLDEVLLRLKHPNGGVRKETLGSVRELVGQQPEKDVGKVLKALGAIIADDDAAVRKALLDLLGWVFGVVPQALIFPHMPLFLLQTSSALSHIFPEIRLDAAKLVQLLLEHVPQQVVGGWPAGAGGEASSSKVTLQGSSAAGGSTILDGLRLALGIEGTTSSANSSRLSAGAKLVLLRAVLAFLQHALGGHEEESTGKVSLPQGMFDGWTETTRKTGGKGKEKELGGPLSVFDINDEGWVAAEYGDALDLANNDAWEAGRIRGEADLDGDQETIRVAADLYLQFHPVLLSTFLETAPVAFSVGGAAMAPSTAMSDETAMSLCSVTASIAEVLAKTVLARHTGSPADSAQAAEVRTCVSDFLRRMAAWFPFRSSRTVLSPTGLSPALALSLSYANLAVLLAPQPVKLEWPKSTPATRRDEGWRGRVKVVEQAWETMRAQASKAKGKGKAGGADVWALGEVADWVVDTLVSDPQMVVLSGADKQSSSKDVLAPAMTPAVYAAMLPVIFALLSQPPSPNRGQAGDEDDISTSVWMAFLSHQAKEASTSHLRALADEFLISVLAIHEQRHPTLPFFVPVGSPVRAQIKTWVENVPKSLWELGNRDEAATERLLLFLLDLGLRGSKQAESPVALFPADAFAGLAARLAPFFHLSHPSKGSIPGPWTKLSLQHVERLGANVGKTWMEWDAEGKLASAMRQVDAI